MASRHGVFSSSVGTKILIGLTGVLLFFYLLIHIAGNLVVFLGPAAFNKYAFTLESNPLIPVVEIGLLLIFLVHVYKTVTMFLSNQQARTVGYVQKKRAGHTSRKSFASSTMIFCCRAKQRGSSTATLLKRSRSWITTLTFRP